MSQCGHPKKQIDINWSEEQEGYWAQCQVCEAHTAVFKEESEALGALKRMKREKPGGSPTEKGGRPKELPADSKLATFMLTPSHKKTLDKYQKKNDLKSRSEALRHLLENLPAAVLEGAAI